MTLSRRIFEFASMSITLAPFLPEPVYSGATLVYSVSATTMIIFEFERSFISIYLGGSGCVSGVAAATQQSGRKRLEILL